MELLPVNKALVERFNPWKASVGDALHEHVSISASELNILLNAARGEGYENAAAMRSTAANRAEARGYKP